MVRKLMVEMGLGSLASSLAGSEVGPYGLVFVEGQPLMASCGEPPWINCVRAKLMEEANMPAWNWHQGD